MPLTLLIPLITQVGLPLATKLIQDWETGASYTAAQFMALIQQYGTKTSDQYLTEAGGPPALVGGGK